MAEKMTSAHSWKDIRAVLSKADNKDVLKLVGELYALRKENLEFLHARYLKDDRALGPYKETIAQSISPAEPWKTLVKISQARKAISDYRKAAGDPENLADLMLFYVECGVTYIQEWEDADEAFYSSLVSVFTDGMEMLDRCDQNAIRRLLPRFEEAVQSTAEMIWSFHDSLCDIFEIYAPDV